ncbi:methyltransferase N6AMT1 [Episyrphus balteatus]|uniref:methyltransferase N6AMT1 n=1 Tax=Episyrphus balteatus TaxID=286459 RepID=UPI0024862827|nr:methyltransferase N6AMT1 [Episyrphus balteatus]
METPHYDHLTPQDYEKVYEPAEDTFLLLDAIEDNLEYLKSIQPGICVEIGSGSGLVITALSQQFPNAVCLSTDINQWACNTTKRTALRNQASVDPIRTNLLDNIRDKLVDVLLFNPPYVVTTDDELNHKERNFDSEKTDNNLIYSWAGGVDGRRVIDALIDKLDSILSPNGVLYLLVLKENNLSDIISKFACKQFIAVIFKERRIPGEHLFILKVIRF